MPLTETLQRLMETRQAATAATAATASASGVTPAASEALERAIAYYSPEGGYGKGVEAGIERGRVKAVSGGMQALVSAGLAGTTMAGGLGKKFEEEVAMPTRARVEESRGKATAELEVLKAQIIQGATEAARTRALQTYLAKMQSGTQLQLAAMRQTPSIVQARPEPTGTAAGAGAGGATQHFGTYPSPFGGESRRSVVSPGDPTTGQRIIGGPAAGGMALSGGRYLRPEQVEWRD